MLVCVKLALAHLPRLLSVLFLTITAAISARPTTARPLEGGGACGVSGSLATRAGCAGPTGVAVLILREEHM